MNAGISDASAQNDIARFRKNAQQAVKRAFLAAQLITHSLELAESSVLEAIEQWDPETESEERLVRRAMANAVQASRSAAAQAAEAATLPPRLASLAALARPLRQLFIMRFIGGWSRQFCGEMLLMNRRRVENHTRAALEQLATAERN